MKILNFGSCNIDFVYTLDHIVKAGETETTYRLETFPGGKGLNQSIALARAGAKVFHAGCIGNDGSMLLETLKDSGVDVSYMKAVDTKNGHAIIQVSSQGENSIFLYPGSNVMVSESYVDCVLKDFSKDDIILLQNEINNVGYIIDKAFEKKMQIVLNPSPFNEQISNIDLKKITYLVLNEVEAEEYTGYKEPEKILAYFDENYPQLKVMLTLGGNGCVYSFGKLKERHPVFDVSVVDTTAAGDTFTGYFISGISRGEDISKVLKFASAAAAISVSREGAAPSIPDLDYVESKIDSMQLKLKRSNPMKKIEAYCKENLSDISLIKLSGHMGYTAVYTGNLIKKHYGKNFSEFIQDLRCAVAAEYLRETDIPVGVIINTVGYENGSFFRKIFKNRYGLNPLDYRKRN